MTPNKHIVRSANAVIQVRPFFKVLEYRRFGSVILHAFCILLGCFDKILRECRFRFIVNDIFAENAILFRKSRRISVAVNNARFRNGGEVRDLIGQPNSGALTSSGRYAAASIGSRESMYLSVTSIPFKYSLLLSKMRYSFLSEVGRCSVSVAGAIFCLYSSLK